MKIIFDEEDAVMVAKAMAKSRGYSDTWIATLDQPHGQGSNQDTIMVEALRVVAAFRNKYSN